MVEGKWCYKKMESKNISPFLNLNKHQLRNLSESWIQYFHVLLGIPEERLPKSREATKWRTCVRTSFPSRFLSRTKVHDKNIILNSRTNFIFWVPHTFHWNVLRWSTKQAFDPNLQLHCQWKHVVCVLSHNYKNNISSANY